MRAEGLAIRCISSLYVKLSTWLITLCYYSLVKFCKIGLKVTKTVFEDTASFVAKNILGYVNAFRDTTINYIWHRTNYVKEMIESSIAVVTKSYTFELQETFAEVKKIITRFLCGSISVKVEYEAGDILYRRMNGVLGMFIYHYGVFIGKKEVIQFTCSACKASEGILEKVSLDEFLAGELELGVITKFEYATKNKKDICRKAFEIYQLDEEREDWCEYNWRRNNCEHFANYCATGHKYSSQSSYFLINCVL
ncbi:NC domain protein [Oopsacas minuta]|uniref:NC domain protein n=1 Tax=Oopsacas minuta TaxID=111878 RepID=A0AAV7KCV8_9METZ|nr:NC domain protein [Oopsacas minuta]